MSLQGDSGGRKQAKPSCGSAGSPVGHLDQTQQT